MNKIKAVILGCILTAMLVACGGQTSSSTAVSSASTAPASSASAAEVVSEAASGAASEAASVQELQMTAEELAKFDGQNGNPAYVAVEGIIYDVTNAPEWKGGKHKDGITAGKDLTEEIKNSAPHGVKVLENLPVIGRLV